MYVPNCIAVTVFRNHYSRLLVGWCPVYSSIWFCALYGCLRACVPSSGVDKSPFPGSAGSWLRTLHPNNAEESGTKIMVHVLVRWWVAEVGCQGFCRSAWVSELP